MHDRQAQACRIVPRERGLYAILRTDQHNLDAKLAGGLNGSGDCCLRSMITADCIQYDLHASTCSNI
jgi:hypothetical protein